MACLGGRIAYDAERRPVGVLTMGQALARFGARMAPPQGRPSSTTAPSPWATGTPPPWPGSGAQDSAEPVPPAQLSGQPGTRAPHVPVPGDAAGSFLDLYGDTFVLLTGPGGRPWLDALDDLRLREKAPPVNSTLSLHNAAGCRWSSSRTTR